MTLSKEKSRRADRNQERKRYTQARAERRLLTSRLVEFADLFHALSFIAAEAVVRFVPETRWGVAARAFARVSTVVRRQRSIRDRAFLESNLAASCGRNPPAIHLEIVANMFEERVLLRKAARDPTWRPKIRLSGRSWLDKALANDRGAVLWVAPTIFAPLVTKIALHDAGYAVSHLSVQWHGQARSRFGRWLVNAREAATEGRFVERVVIPPTGEPARALKKLGRRLLSNGVVTITAIGNTQTPIETCLLGGRLILAPGAPRLALLHRAALLSVMVGRDAAGAFCVRLEPLTAGEGVGASRSLDVDRLARAFTARYARCLVDHPTLWDLHLRNFRALGSESERIH